MSGLEALVVAFGLFIGYWVVGKLLADKPKSDAQSKRDENAPPDAGTGA